MNVFILYRGRMNKSSYVFLTSLIVLLDSVVVTVVFTNTFPAVTISIQDISEV